MIEVSERTMEKIEALSLEWGLTYEGVIQRAILMADSTRAEPSRPEKIAGAPIRGQVHDMGTIWQ